MDVDSRVCTEDFRGKMFRTTFISNNMIDVSKLHEK